MLIEWTSILGILLLLTITLIIIKLFDKKFKLNGELKRKLFHVIMGISMLSFPYIFQSFYSVICLAVIALVVLGVLKNTKLKSGLGDVIYGVSRDSLGEIFFVISVALIFYLSKGDKILYSIPILILTFADSTAALIGKNYGKNNLAESQEDAKSIEGSFMFFMVAFMCTHVPLLLYTTVGREETLIISLIVGFNVALIEMISHTGNDNLLIPLTTYAFLASLINSDLMILRQNLITLGIVFFIVTIVNRIKVMSKLALVEILVVGYLIILLYGFYAVVPPLMLVLTCMRLPKIKENEKNNLYNSRIIETNVIVGIVICVIATICNLKSELFMMYTLCFAMHMSVNSFVRLKYYFDFKESDAVIFAYIKGFFLVFVPGMIVQRFVFGNFEDLKMLIFMALLLFLSCIFIMFEKKNVKEEEITIKNGLMHMKIVAILTIVLGLVEYIQVVL